MRKRSLGRNSIDAGAEYGDTACRAPTRINFPVRTGSYNPRCFLVLGFLFLMLLVACGPVTSEAPTLTPTWAYTAPTLEASPVVLIYPPTEVPADYIGPGQSNPTAAALPWDSSMPPILIEFVGSEVMHAQIPLGDGTVLQGMLYQIATPPELRQYWPGVLLVGASPESWGDFPLQLRDAGFTVLVMEMEYRLTVADFTDVLQAFNQVGTVMRGRIGVIGADVGAGQAFMGCAIEWLCRVAVLLSPMSQEALLNVVDAYNPRPFLVAASRDDTTAFETAQSLEGAATGEISALYYDSAGHGVELLTAPGLPQAMIDWLQRFLIP